MSGGTPMPLKNGDREYVYKTNLLLMGKKPERDVVIEAMIEWKEVNDRRNDKVSFSFEVPKKVMYYVLCLNFMSGKEGKATGTMASRGMRVVKCGEI